MTFADWAKTRAEHIDASSTSIEHAADILEAAAAYYEATQPQARRTIAELREAASSLRCVGEEE